MLVGVAPDDLRDISDAASNITVQGARYPEHIERMTGPPQSRGTQPGIHGNDGDQQRVAAKLIREMGFDPADAGQLRIGNTEPFALLVAQLVYEGKGYRNHLSVRVV